MTKEKEIKKRSANSKLKWLHERHFEKLVVISNALNFIIPLVWVNLSLFITYSPQDSLFGWTILPLALITFYLAYHLLATDKSNLFTIGLLMGLTPLYIFLGLYTIYHMILAALNIMVIFMLINVHRGSNKLLPRFKTKFGKYGILIMILCLILPVAVFLLLPMFPIPIVIEDNSADTLEINWMWAEIWPMEEEVLDALNYCNNLPGINVSVMLGLPEDIMTSYIYTNLLLNMSTNLTIRGITWDFMPLLPLDIDGNPETNDYGYDGLYINDLTIDRYMQTIDIMDVWVDNYSLADKFRVICIDTELYWEKRDEMYWPTGWWDSYTVHSNGSNKLDAAITKMRQINGSHPVVAATFGMHLDDFVDFDDAQHQLWKMSAFPPFTWDGVGVMIYETGVGSDFSIYSSCNAMKYYLGEAAIPYIISSEGDPKNPQAEDYNHIATKFKIIKNMGFRYAGAWGLTDFLYYIDNYSLREGKARVIGGERFSIEQFKQLHEEISCHRGNIGIYYETINHSLMHFLLQYIDLWLFNGFSYDGVWPKINSLPPGF